MRRLWRVETRLVQYVVAEDEEDCMQIAAEHLRDDALALSEAGEVSEALRMTTVAPPCDAAAARARIRADGWLDCIPWGWDSGNETTLEVALALADEELAP